MDNTDLTNKIKDYVKIDNELKNESLKIQELRDKKKEISNEIIKYCENNNALNMNIELNDSKLKIVNSNVTSPLSLKYLEKCLNEIIDDKENIEKIINYIKKNREVKSSFEIKRTYNK